MPGITGTCHHHAWLAILGFLFDPVFHSAPQAGLVALTAVLPPETLILRPSQCPSSRGPHSVLPPEALTVLLPLPFHAAWQV